MHVRRSTHYCQLSKTHPWVLWSGGRYSTFLEMVEPFQRRREGAGSGGGEVYVWRTWYNGFLNMSGFSYRTLGTKGTPDTTKAHEVC